MGWVAYYRLAEMKGHCERRSLRARYLTLRGVA
ncbi:hypothetical protein [Alicyclobacillus contaminans]